MQARNNLAVVVGNQQLDLNRGARNRVRNLLLELLDALAGACRYDDVLGLALAHPLQHEGVGRVGLVQHNDFGDVAGVHLGKDLADGANLALRVRVGGIHHVQDDVGVGNLLQGGAECLHQLGRQRAHETHRVGEGVADAVGGLRLAHGRVQGCEQGVLHEHARVGQTVQQGGLTGVRVTGNSHRGHAVAAAVQALRLAGRGHRGNFTLELGHAGAQAAAVHLNLGFTGTARADALTGGGTATGLTGQGGAPTAQTRQHVLQLGQLDLRLTLAGLSVLCKDVENQGGAVDDLHLDDILEGAALGGGQLGVDNHCVGAGGLHDVLELQGLAGAEEGARVRLEAALNQAVQHLGAGGLGQRGQLTQGVFGVLDGAFGPQAGQHHAFQAQLTVLDLGDVLQLGGKVSYSAQGAALGEVFLISIELGVLTLNIGNFTRAGVEHAAATARRRALVMRGARGIVGGQ